MKNYGVLIPAYQPDHHLSELAKELTAKGFQVVVVNDGSTTGLEIFEELKEMKNVTVLLNPVNRGMGGALKTGFAHMAEKGFSGVIAADADGQHSASDIERMAEALAAQKPGTLVLGARDIAQMPPRSKAGNSVTRVMFRLLYGIDLRDTQTGLRGIPLTKDSIPGLLELPGERYEFQMEVLIYSGKLFPEGIVEIPIQTIYIDNNRSSHFRPLKDGAKIYSVLFKNLPKFMLSSLLAFLVDYSLFNLLYYALQLTTAPATVLARLVSCTVNYNVNRRLVFKNPSSRYTAPRFFFLAGVILVLNCMLMNFLVEFCHLPAFAAKIPVECLLYLLSFTVQSKLASEKRK